MRPPHLRPISFNFMHFLPENRMCAPHLRQNSAPHLENPGSATVKGFYPEDNDTEPFYLSDFIVLVRKLTKTMRYLTRQKSNGGSKVGVPQRLVDLGAPKMCMALFIQYADTDPVFLDFTFLFSTL